MALSKILFPVDFSGRARQAARHARMIANCSGSQVTLLHVLPPPPIEFDAALPRLCAERVELAKARLDEFGAQMLEGTRYGALVQTGDPAVLIVDYARKSRVDLIVMPTHGAGAFREFLLGSTTAKILHDAECPVLTGVHIQRSEPGAGKFDNVVCAVDLGPQTGRVIRWASGMARTLGARLFVVHALPGVGARDYQGEFDNQQARAARNDLQMMIDQGRAEAIAIVAPGAPAQAIVTQVEELGADLLVIGRGATGGLFGRLRSNAYELVRCSPCPVVSV